MLRGILWSLGDDMAFTLLSREPSGHQPSLTCLGRGLEIHTPDLEEYQLGSPVVNLQAENAPPAA